MTNQPTPRSPISTFLIVLGVIVAVLVAYNVFFGERKQVCEQDDATAWALCMQETGQLDLTD